MIFTIQNFPSQSANIKGQRTPNILEYTVAPSRPLLGVGRTGKSFIYIPLRQDFTVANSGGSAAQPTIKLDYPIAAQNADNPVGENVIVYYSTNGTSFNKGTKVTTTPANNGEYQVTSLSAGTIKVYVPASGTRYFRVYFRPAAGRLLIGRQPPAESADQTFRSVFERDLAAIHTMNQVESFSVLTLGADAVFPAKSKVVFQLFMPNVSAAQSSETNITKTVTREALFIPYTTDPNAWNETVGVLELPIDY
jgi:hypothetical protein